MEASSRAGVAGKAEDVVDAVSLAPSHEVFAAGAGVARSQISTSGQALPDLSDNEGDLLLGARRGVDIRGPELRQQKLAPAKNIQRQIAVAFVVAVEEPAFLPAMQRIVGRVEIEDDARRGAGLLSKLGTKDNSFLIDRRAIVDSLR